MDNQNISRKDQLLEIYPMAAVKLPIIMQGVEHCPCDIWLIRNKSP